MIHDPVLLDALERFGTERWQGRVFRHLLGSAPPELANVRGARWNSPGTSALYTSLAEIAVRGSHLIEQKEIPAGSPAIPSVRREFRSCQVLEGRATG